MLPARFNPGLRIGNYIVQREIGRGGQGVVLEARHVSLGTPVALKLLLAPDPEASQRFLLEAKTLARLRHPNLIRVSDHGRLPNGAAYLVMDFIAGTDLASLVRTRGLPDIEVTVSILGTLARILHYCHGLGIVHRDVKPQNVLLEEDSDRVLLVDFGLVKRTLVETAWSTQDLRSLTEDGDILGTPAFMAPEQASSEFGGVGPATDIYALGGVLYFLLTGRRPFEGGNIVNTLVQVMEAVPPDPRDVEPMIPPEVAKLCRSCLAKDPRDRPESAKAFAEALEAACVLPRRPQDSASPRMRRNALAVMALAVVGVGVGTSVFSKDPSPRRGAPNTAFTGDELSPAVTRASTPGNDSFPADDLDWFRDDLWSPAEKAARLAQAEGVAARKPDSAQSWINLARACLGVGEVERARTVAQRAIEIDPSSPSAYRIRGMALVRLRGPDNSQTSRENQTTAQLDFDRALALDPGDWQSLRERAVVRSNLGDRAGAEADFAAWINLQPTAQAYGSRAVFEARRGRPEAARSDLERALELDPTSLRTLKNLAGIAEAGKDWQRASNYHSQILKIKPDALASLKSQVVLLARLKRHRHVIETALILEKLEPEDTQGPLRRAFAHQHLEEFAASQAPLERLLSLQPAHQEGLLLLVRALTKAEEWEAVVKRCDQILALTPPVLEPTLGQIKQTRAFAISALGKPTSTPPESSQPTPY